LFVGAGGAGGYGGHFGGSWGHFSLYFFGAILSPIIYKLYI